MKRPRRSGRKTEEAARRGPAGGRDGRTAAGRRDATGPVWGEPVPGIARYRITHQVTGPAPQRRGFSLRAVYAAVMAEAHSERERAQGLENPSDARGHGRAVLLGLELTAPISGMNEVEPRLGALHDHRRGPFL